MRSKVRTDINFRWVDKEISSEFKSRERLKYPKHAEAQDNHWLPG